MEGLPRGTAQAGRAVAGAEVVLGHAPHGPTPPLQTGPEEKWQGMQQLWISPGGCLQLDLLPRLPHLLRLAPPRPALFMSLVLLQAFIFSFLDSGSSRSVTTPSLRSLSKTETRPCHCLVSGPSQAPDCPQGGIHLPYSNMHGPPGLTAPFPSPSACSPCSSTVWSHSSQPHALSHLLALFYCPSVRGDGDLISGLCVSPGWSWGSLCCFGARPTIL